MINLTPHTIRVMNANGEILEYAPSGVVARVDSVEVPAGEINGIPVVERQLGAVYGMPENGELCIVSAMVASAVPGMKGVYAPDSGKSAVRNDKGHIDYVVALVKA